MKEQYDKASNYTLVFLLSGNITYTYTLNRFTYLENRTSGGTVISSYAYTLDDAGNRTKVVEHSGRVVEYEYDDAYKLTTETIKEPGKPDHIISYTYDKVGNRKTKTENGFTTTYTYNENNQLVTEDDITYSYDDNGNLKAKNSAEESVEYIYDAENHLTRVETTRVGVTITVEYEYDAEGNRVRKIIDGTLVTNYLVDTNRDYAQVLEERDGNGNLLVRYVYGHDLISQTRGGATSYYHYDGLGNTRALTASSEAVTDTYTYDAFGNLLDKTGTTTNDYLYTGEFFDANVGFYYLRARYMSPAVGRFITIDPFAGRNRDPYSLHKYLYAHANPVNHIDPSGRITLNEVTVTGGIIGALSGWAVYHYTHAPSERSLWGYTKATVLGAAYGGMAAYSLCYLFIGAGITTAEIALESAGTFYEVALGRWDNPSYWKNLVEGRYLYHLGLKESAQNALQRSLALGDKVFSRMLTGSNVEIFARIKEFLLKPNVTKIYFDLNRIKSASKVFGVPPNGWFAREELKIILETPQLLDKTVFIKMGIEVTPSMEYLRWLLE